ncbi:MAG: hypothetical protein HQL03_04925 [Nitrospirae bacterium]|nr:hypothetical protein [Nitrospirota bacterium]
MEGHTLEAYGVDTSQVSLSGFSSGGHMAVQVHVTYSSIFTGIAVFSGATYYQFSKDKLFGAMMKCLKQEINPSGFLNDIYNMAVAGNFDIDKLIFNLTDSLNEKIDLPTSINETHKMARAQKIDDPSHMARQNIYLYTAEKDTIVAPAFMDIVYKYYLNFVSNSNIKYVKLPNAQHGMPTNNFGKPCNSQELPFINNCNYSGAGEALSHIYGRLNPPTNPMGRLIPFNQAEFYSGSYLHDTGYIYVPTACKGGGACRLHVVFHGCMQNPEWGGDIFYQKAGFNEWAESNDIIVLYPQTKNGKIINQAGCWDFFGYENPDFYNNQGPQIKAIKAMIDRITARR